MKISIISASHRTNSQSKKIAVFDGYLEPNNSLWKEYNLIPVCNTVDQAIEASKNNIIFMLHIDTGMNRLGLSITEANDLLVDKSKLNYKNLILMEMIDNYFALF